MELNCLYDTEIIPKDIFISMKKNTYNNFSFNSFSSISKEYLSLRNDLFSLLKKISSKIGFKSQTYFLCVYYLDILYSQNKKIDCNPNILGLACLLLSAKYCENDPSVPELKYFIRIYNRIVGSKNSISVSDLFYSEVIACKMLNHKLNYYTVYDFNSFFFNHNILKAEQLEDLNISYDDNKYSKDIKFSQKGKKILEKIYRKSRYYLDNLLESQISLKYNSLLLSIYIMKKSVEFTLLSEKNFDRCDFSLKDKFLKKNNDYFNSIIKGYYNIDYENMPEYKKLLEEYDFIKIFKQIKKTRDDFSPINFKKTNSNNNTSNGFNKTPNKSFNLKPINQKVTENNYSSSKKNFNKLKSSNNIHSKKNSTNSLISFSGYNIPRVSYHQNNENINQKPLFRNLGVDNCIENYKQHDYKENIISDKNINNKDKNKFLFLFKLNSQNNLIYNLNKTDKKNENMSPYKFENSDKYINYNFQKNNDFKNNIDIIKRTKTKDLDKNNISSSKDFDRSIRKDNLNQNINNNMSGNINLTKPYSKKVIQNYGNKLKNFNQMTNKNNFDNSNNDDINIDEKKEEITKPLYNIVNRLPNYKITNNNNKEEIYPDSKIKININKRYSFNINKDINLSNIKKDYKEKIEKNSKNKEKIISKFLNINLNPKLSDGNIITPLSSFFTNKKNEDEIFSSTNYINRTNKSKKKYETKTVKSLNNLGKSIDNKNSYLRINNLSENLNYELSKKSQDINIKNKDIQIKENNDDNRKNNDKKKYNYFIDSNENIFSNTLSSSLKGTRYSLISLNREKKKETDRNNNKLNNKILLTDYTNSGDENINNLENDINDYLEVGNLQKFDSKISKVSKRIQVKKNISGNSYNINDNKNYKKMKYQNSAIYKGYSNKSNDFRNFEEINDEDSNNYNPKNLILYSLKNEGENNLNKIAQEFKKNHSTIVINNNININFGNKTNIGLKEKKRYKNIVKNSSSQINNNNGQNSISYLLHKIPLRYKNSESNINSRKKSLINIGNKK